MSSQRYDGPQKMWAGFEFNRRRFLKTSTAAAAAAMIPQADSVLSAAGKKRPRVAAIITSFTFRSHAHVIMENFLHPYLFNGKKTDPGVDVVSFYLDQTPSGDMSREASRKYKIPIYKTIDKALCLGGDQLAVDAVLAIGEHGSYPVNELKQTEYPRKRFFDEIVAVMRRSKRFVPLFNDKHLSYRWDWAKEMVDTSRELGIPFMAGSSVPLAQRRPAYDLPVGAQIEEAISIHGGGLESYDFHGLEVLQSMVETRRGGETGIEAVEFFEGERLEALLAPGGPTRKLAEAAMRAQMGSQFKSLSQIKGEPKVEQHAHRIHYKDGLKATVLKVGSSATRWNFACRMKGADKIQATSFYTGPWNNRNLFKALSHSIQQHFIHGETPYPVERTLMTTGALAAAMHARVEKEHRVTTPHLEFAYAAKDYRAMREMGASWKIITDKTPPPQEINPGPTE